MVVLNVFQFQAYALERAFQSDAFAANPDNIAGRIARWSARRAIRSALRGRVGVIQNQSLYQQGDGDKSIYPKPRARAFLASWSELLLGFHKA